MRIARLANAVLAYPETLPERAALWFRRGWRRHHGVAPGDWWIRRRGEAHETLVWPWLCAMWRPGGFWMRLGAGGPGIWFGTYVDNPMLFSERNGYQRVFRLGNWARWRWLKAKDPRCSQS